MLIKRTLAALVLAAIGFPAVVLGGVYFSVLIAVLLGVSAWEYGRIFRAANYQASTPILVGGVLLVYGARAYFPNLAPAALTLSILVAMAWHLIAYEKGREPAATDFTVTVGGLVYIGWIGSYLYDLRVLENGVWWFFLTLFSVWFADTFAYFIGSAFGKHKMSPRLSPKKSWEGYWGGVVCSTLGMAGLSVWSQKFGGPALTWWQGAIFGAVLSLLTVLGDLGESMLKRQGGVKDSSHIIPGHGGVFDRIDSWLWGAALGYFIILWFFI